MMLSVVVPAFNEEELLPRLLKSLKKQQLPEENFEVIVVDNNSTDRTAFLAQKLGATVVTETRQGITYARDTGARFARGDVIVGTDADCVLPSDYLSIVFSHFQQKNLHMLIGLVFMPEAPVFIRIMILLVHKVGLLLMKKRQDVPIFLCWGQNYAYRRKIFLEVGGFNLHNILLEKAINTGGTDDQDIVTRFKKSGTVMLDPLLTLQSSPRRMKNRFLYWFFVEHCMGFMVNSLLYKLFGVVIPIPSYFKRVKPSKLQSFSLGFGLLCMILLPSYLFFHSTPKGSALSKTAQAEWKKLVIASANLDEIRATITGAPTKIKEILAPSNSL